MAEIILFTPKAELDAAANLRGFVDMCRSKLTVFGADLPFQNDVWDVTDAVATKGNGSKRERITFSNAATVDQKAPEMMREPFLSFAKAYVRYMHGMRPTKIIHNRVAALRAIEAALLETGLPPDPVQIDSRILNRAAQIVADRFSDGAAYRVGGQIEMLGIFLSENRLVAVPIRWRNPIKRPSSAVRVGKEFDEKREEMMPSPAALDALPRIFRIATEPADVITVSIAALLLASPDRISEVLTLPEACEVREPRKGKEDAYGLRWWPAKGAEPMIKWLVPSMGSVVEEALQKIRSVTAEARRIAKWYEQFPDQLYLAANVAHLRGQEWLSMKELAKILGINGGAAANTWCKTAGVATEKLEGAGKTLYVRFRDVEAAVLRMLPKGFPVLDNETGLKYSEALLIVRRNELGAQRGTYRCMIEAVSIGQVNTGLGSRVKHGYASIFSRFGFTEPDGSHIEVTSHQFRHYLNTLAQSGGLSQLDIAKWSGRKDIRQNEVYDHLTPGQMLQKIRDAVGGDQMFGPLAEIPKKVLIRRDEFARLVVPTAHTTDLGYCVHDYTASPCQLHMDCIHCQDLVCVKGDAEREALLRRRLDEAKGLMERAQAATSEGYSGSDRWLDHHRTIVDRLVQLCAIMDDPKVPDGAVIQLAAPSKPSLMDQVTERGQFQLENEQTRLLAGVKALLGE
ncbi:integrase [Laribacter hongkongensis]|uniref:Integrase n=1 Tax=Laribacter hongkongensis TaxID=168471 RepID=A0ABD4SL64_9NEIS|nr:integrase [Laribacter hongkongensis]MCG9024455.1 integrase [Laribacter hongkongensis]MCG9099189.1 integrase [Laribacter hongkongensis]MCG9103112.1 integrase [Laribacter hongkongensis]MCG9111436.1 integrase [Laribacter hongkongensis]MCG9117345.1 integrase [Laribacter hongkongensis]